MKEFIIIFFFFLFFFVTVKDIYDEKTFLTEDVRLLEKEVGEKDSLVLKLRYENAKLQNKLDKMIEDNRVKKPIKKPITNKNIEPIVKDSSQVIKDTL